LSRPGRFCFWLFAIFQPEWHDINLIDRFEQPRIFFIAARGVADSYWIYSWSRRLDKG